MSVEAFCYIISSVMDNLPDEDIKLAKKRNRIKKLTPKLHKISHESGRSTKDLWRRIIEKSKSSRNDSRKSRNRITNMGAS